MSDPIRRAGFSPASQAFLKDMLQVASDRLLKEMDEHHKAQYGDGERPDLRKAYPAVAVIGFLIIIGNSLLYSRYSTCILPPAHLWRQGALSCAIFDVFSAFAVFAGITLSSYVLVRSLPVGAPVRTSWKQQSKRMLLMCLPAVSVSAGLVIIFRSFEKVTFTQFDDTIATAVVTAGGLLSVYLFQVLDSLIEHLLLGWERWRSAPDYAVGAMIYDGIYKLPRPRKHVQWGQKVKRGVLWLLRFVINRLTKWHVSSAS